MGICRRGRHRSRHPRPLCWSDLKKARKAWLGLALAVCAAVGCPQTATAQTAADRASAASILLRELKIEGCRSCRVRVSGQDNTILEVIDPEATRRSNDYRGEPTFWYQLGFYDVIYYSGPGTVYAAHSRRQKTEVTERISPPAIPTHNQASPPVAPRQATRKTNPGTSPTYTSVFGHQLGESLRDYQSIAGNYERWPVDERFPQAYEMTILPKAISELNLFEEWKVTPEGDSVVFRAGFVGDRLSLMDVGYKGSQSDNCAVCDRMRKVYGKPAINDSTPDLTIRSWDMKDRQVWILGQKNVLHVMYLLSVIAGYSNTHAHVAPARFWQPVYRASVRKKPALARDSVQFARMIQQLFVDGVLDSTAIEPGFLGGPEEVWYTRNDLNGDGQPEFFVQYRGGCGSGGCRTIVYGLDAGLLLQLVDDTELAPAKATHHGYRDLVATGSAGIAYTRSTQYQFDGYSYVAESCVVEETVGTTIVTRACEPDSSH